MTSISSTMLPPLTPIRLNRSPRAQIPSSRSGFLRGVAEATWSCPTLYRKTLSTLFLLLGETSADAWVQKLDWIAMHGGMALLDVHPDYLRFSGETSCRRTYPAELYEGFLEYVRRRYGRCLWNPLPRELAAFVKRMRASPAEAEAIECRRISVRKTGELERVG